MDDLTKKVYEKLFPFKEGERVKVIYGHTSYSNGLYYRDFSGKEGIVTTVWPGDEDGMIGVRLDDGISIFSNSFKFERITRDE